MRTRRNLTAVLVVVVAGLAVAATAFAKTVTESATAPLATGGSVSATLSYTPVPKSHSDVDIHLDITRAGQQVLSESVTSKLCSRYCLVSEGDGSRAIHVADLQGNGEPDVVVDLYTGGAHCCSTSEFYTYDAATQTYTQTEHDWGDPGYELKQIAGKYIFDTDDDTFAYAFTDFAASGLPLELLTFNGTSFVNVTDLYPSLIKQNAALYLNNYKSRAPSYDDTDGVIAAWAADEDELGNSATVAKYLRQQAAAGHLKSGTYTHESGTAFIKKLDAFLKKEGYLTQR